MKKTNILRKILRLRKKKREQADRKRRLADRIRYDIALIHQETVNQPLATRQQ